MSLKLGLRGTFLLLCGLLLCSQSLRAQAVLLHHFTFDEVSGLTAQDDVTASNATLTGFEDNNDAQWVDGFIDGGLFLGADATLDNYIEFALDEVTSGFSIALWINPGPQTSNGGEWTLFDNGEIGFNMYTNTGAEGGVFQGNVAYWDTVFANFAGSSTTMNPGTWYHVTLTTEGLGGTKQFYLNGVLETSRLVAPSAGGDASVATISGWAAATIGRLGATDGGGRGHNSTIDDARIYSGVLTPAEVLALIPSIPNVPPAFGAVSPEAGNALVDPADGFQFNVNAVGDGVTIAPEGIQVIINGVDVSGDLTIGGTPQAREVSYDLLVADTLYDIVATVTDSNAEDSSAKHYFGTFSSDPTPPGLGLLQHFKLDETGGLLALDQVGGRVGRLNGFVDEDDSQWVAGQVGGALDMLPDPSSMSFIMPVGVDATQTGGFTIALWVNPGDEIAAGVNGERTLWDGGGMGFNIITNDTFDRVLLFWDGDFNNLEVGTTTLVTGTWYHVAIVSEGPGGAKTFYIDGQEEPDQLFAPENGGTGAATDPGWDPGSGARLGDVGGRTHDSSFDDLRIYNRALSPDEIERLATGSNTATFVRADANGDGVVNIADPSYNANFLFGIGAATPPPCRDAADANGDGALNIADVSFIANFVFGVDPATPPPTPGSGPAPACNSEETILGCETEPAECFPG